MQPRYPSDNNDYSDTLVDIINHHAKNIAADTRSTTTASILNMLTYSIEAYEKSRMEDLQNMNPERAAQVTYATHLYQNHYEKHLHRHAYSVEAAELFHAINVYEESVYDDIQTMHLLLARVRAEMFVQYLEAAHAQLHMMLEKAERDKRLEEIASDMQQQIEFDGHSDDDITCDDELTPLLPHVTFENDEEEDLVWHNSPLKFEGFDSDREQQTSSESSPASPRFFATPTPSVRSDDEFDFSGFSISDNEVSASDSDSDSDASPTFRRL